MATQQRRKSSYSQVSIAAPRVPANMAWFVESYFGDTIIIQITTNWQKAFLNGVPNFTFDQPFQQVNGATLVGQVLTLTLDRALVYPTLMTLGVNDPALRNYYGGFLSTAETEINEPVTPVEPFELIYDGSYGTVLSMANGTDDRGLYGATNDNIIVNGESTALVAVTAQSGTVNVDVGHVW